MSVAPSPLPPFLFSVDLEDIRQLVPEGDQLRDRVEATTEQILAFLERHDARCTFFTTGDVARRYPGLVKRIAAAGHEIGCHSSEHIPLDRQDGASFRADLEACLDAYARAGVERVQGYRAPIASLTAGTRWAYGVLRELGFRYSASVLAARNPLYGWPDFGPDRPTRMDGLWELPASLVALPGAKVPFAGGVYFRILPYSLIRHCFRRRLNAGRPVLGYLHPYDVDREQERFMYPEIGGSRFYNRLMHHGRGKVIPRLEKLMTLGARIRTYGEYVRDHLEQAPGRA
jgi:polysaccharide deacetylase family protein (PEP-CTERM system associated)